MVEGPECTDDPTNCRDKLLVYSIMSNLCSEFSGSDEGKAADSNYMLSKTFSNLLLQALSNFPLSTPASMEAAEALLSAVSLHSISVSSGQLITVIFGTGHDDDRYVQAILDLVAPEQRYSNVPSAGLQQTLTYRP